MRTPAASDPLLSALAALSGLAGPGDQAVLAGLRGRLADRRLRVLVTGEAKRGKSTLVNAMLGRAVLPMGVTPVTALATTVRQGTDEHATAVSGDGRAERFPLAALDDLVTERGNPANRRGLASVTVVADAPVLALGVELVDTPGTGSVYAHNTSAAWAALDTMDAAVFVLTADPPVSASERKLMTQVAELSVTMFVVLNKADYLDGAGLAEALDFTARVAGEATGHPARVYPLSARAALSGPGDPGFTVFMADFTAYLDQGRAADLRLSVAAQARRMAAALADEVRLTRHAARQVTGSAAERVEEFAARLAAVSARRQDAADLAAAESARMLAELNASAQRAVRDCAGSIGARLEALLMGGLRTAGPAEIERAGRERLADMATGAAETWRQQQAELLEQGLARLDGRLTQDLRAELDVVRDAAAQLLGLTLAVPGPGERLAPDLRFFYLVAGQAGQTELLAGAIRKWLPGETGRRRARAYLHREAASLVPQQIGRARADLQYRLAEATRQLTRAVANRYDESTGRLAGALAAAAAAREASAGEQARLDGELAGREQALDRVLALLAGAGASTVAAARVAAGPAAGR
jgi:GTP-binding protein EngB required for normal cell division